MTSFLNNHKPSTVTNQSPTRHLPIAHLPINIRRPGHLPTAHSPTGTFTDRDIYRPGTFTDRDIYRPQCSILSSWSTLNCLMGHLPTETFTDRPITDRAALCLVTGPILAAWEGHLPTRTFTDQGTHGLPADYAFPKIKPGVTLTGR